MKSILCKINAAAWVTFASVAINMLNSTLLILVTVFHIELE
jgi:hypothetical protein